MRLAEPSDIPAIKAFYLDNERHKPLEVRANFPIPSLCEIVEAVEDRDFLIVVRVDDGTIVGASGLFRLLTHDDGHIVEMSGMYTSPTVGGLSPFGIQDLMVAVRIVRAFHDLLAEIGPTVILSFVRRTNAASRGAMERSGLEVVESLPAWLEGEFPSWFGWAEAEAWLTFRVAAPAMVWAATRVNSIEASHLHIEFDRQNRHHGRIEHFSMSCDRMLWEAQLADLTGLLSGDVHPAVASIPHNLAFDGHTTAFPPPGTSR